MIDSTAQQIVALHRLPLPALEQRWRQLFGSEPPTYIRRFLIKRLAHRIQELTYGGLSERALAQMRNIAAEAGWDEIASLPGKGGRPKTRRELPVLGTRLVREWNGKRYEVTVTAGGFEYAGKPYRSLSAITKAITGTHWNGRAFFGLRNGPERQR
jgi:hypothetical protein